MRKGKNIMPIRIGEKSIDEKLFFKMMQFNRVMRRGMKHCPHGPEAGPGRCGHGGHGRPDGMQGHGPSMKGPGEGCGHHGPGMHGHAHGPSPEKMRAFAQARLLSLLLYYEDGVRQKVLAEEMRINPSSTSELISKLEAEGYAVRTVDPNDKRATLIKLTEVGRARAYELEDERAERFSRFFTNLTEKEKEQLLKLLEKITEIPDDEEEEESEE